MKLGHWCVRVSWNSVRMEILSAIMKNERALEEEDSKEGTIRSSFKKYARTDPSLTVVTFFLVNQSQEPSRTRPAIRRCQRHR